MNQVNEVRRRIYLKRQLIEATKEEIVALQESITDKSQDLSLEQVFEMIEEGRGKADGHFTLMAFTTGWKAMFKTPDLDTGDGRGEVANIPMNDSIAGAVIDAIYDQAHGK